MLLVGTLALVLDVILVIVVYEAVCRMLPRIFFLRVLSAIWLTLVVDSLVFVTGNFVERPDYGAILLSNLLGKLLAGLFYAAMVSLYLGRFRKLELETELTGAETRDIFDLLTYRQRYERIREQSARDPLTDLFNRRFFDEVLPLELASSLRSGLPTSLLLIDLDHFKRINDEHGHQEGDRVLRETAAAIRESTRAADAPCRIGGEEFAVIMPQAAAAAAGQLADRIRTRLRERISEAQPPLAVERVTLTAGVAQFPSEAASAEDLFRLADRRLYRGKRAGRDRVVTA